MDSWTCVMVEKGPGLIPEAVRMELKVAACRLSLDGLDAMRISTDHCQGTIETEWKSFSVGERFGILFKAEIDAEQGTYRVNFLLNRKDLERGKELLQQFEEEPGAWRPFTGELPAALHDFSDLRLHRTLQ